MKYNWFYYTQHLKESFIDKIIQAGQESKTIDGLIGQDNGVDVRVNKKIRKSKISFPSREKYPEIYDLIYHYGVQANNEAFGFDINTVETCQFTTYNSDNKDFYDWHIDTNWKTEKMCHRKLSVVVQLSEPNDYKGGNFEIWNGNFSKQDKININKKGTVIVFPSFLEHRVTPVTKGKRMSLIGWIQGAKFR